MSKKIRVHTHIAKVLPYVCRKIHTKKVTALVCSPERWVMYLAAIGFKLRGGPTGDGEIESGDLATDSTHINYEKNGI